MVWIKHRVKKVLHVLAPSSFPLFSCCPEGQLFVGVLPWCFGVFLFLLPSETLALCESSQLAVVPANHLITLVFVCYPCRHTLLFNFSVSIYVLSSLAHLLRYQSLQLLWDCWRDCRTNWQTSRKLIQSLKKCSCTLQEINLQHWFSFRQHLWQQSNVFCVFNAQAGKLLVLYRQLEMWFGPKCKLTHVSGSNLRI